MLVYVSNENDRVATFNCIDWVTAFNYLHQELQHLIVQSVYNIYIYYADCTMTIYDIDHPFILVNPIILVIHIILRLCYTLLYFVRHCLTLLDIFQTLFVVLLDLVDLLDLADLLDLIDVLDLADKLDFELFHKLWRK